jgi:8-oxo-dGTP diphosphatase
MITVVAAIITRDSRILICQRRADKAFPLNWEFPGGKVEPGESLADALTREIAEELGVQIKVGPQVYRSQHRYAELSAPIELVFFSAQISGEKPGENVPDEQFATEFAAFSVSAAFNEVKWVNPAELPEYEFLAANAELVSRIASGSLSLE